MRLAESHALDGETMGDCHFMTGRAMWEADREAGGPAGSERRARAVALVTKAEGEYAKVPRLADRARRAAEWLAAH
jgi:hypothetical protein